MKGLLLKKVEIKYYQYNILCFLAGVGVAHILLATVWK